MTGIKSFFFCFLFVFCLYSPLISLIHAEDITSPEAAALSFLTQKSGKGLSAQGLSVNSFKVKKVVADSLKHRTVVRVKQSYKGVSLYGSDASVHVNAQNQVEYFNGVIQQLNLSTTPHITSKDAEIIASEAFPQSHFDSVTSTLDIFTVKDHAFLSWHVVLQSLMPREAWDCFVDAETGKVIAKLNRLQDAMDRQEYAFRGSPTNQTNVSMTTLVLSEGQVTRNVFFQKPFDHLGTVYRYFYKTFAQPSHSA